MRFKTGENLHPAGVALLRNAGHDVLTVVDEGLGGAPDEPIVQVCRQEGRVLLTQDLDFADIRLYPPDQFPGIVVLRLTRQNRQSQIHVLQKLLPSFETADLAGLLWVADEMNVRIHGGET